MVSFVASIEQINVQKSLSSCQIHDMFLQLEF